MVQSTVTVGLKKFWEEEPTDEVQASMVDSRNSNALEL